MSIHNDCGATIRWARRSDDNERFMQPLEFSDFAYIIDDSGTAIEVTVYQIHECKAEEVEKFQENKRRAAEAKGITVPELTNYEVYQVQKEEVRKEDWKIALKVACETCGSPARKKCRSKAKGPKYGSILKNPHPKRLAESIELSWVLTKIAYE